MVASTPAQLRAGIETYLIAQIPGLQTANTDGQTAIQPPAVLVLPMTEKYVDYQVSFAPEGAAYDWSARIVVLVSKADVASGTVQLDGFLSPHGTGSIPAALYADPSCGGVADYVVPVSASWSGNVEYAGQEYMAGTIVLDVGAE